MYRASCDDQFVGPTLRALNVSFTHYQLPSVFRHIKRTIIRDFSQLS